MADGSEKGRDQWADELHKQILLLRYKLRRKLYSGRSEYQKIDIVETEGFGRMLFNDGVAMLSERDEFVYHEMISHVPLFVHPAARRQSGPPCRWPERSTGRAYRSDGGRHRCRRSSRLPLRPRANRRRT